jgi:hypothetical protein
MSLEEKPIVYDHEYLQLDASNNNVQLGEAIEFEIHNKSNSRVVLGCKNPWILQRYLDHEWQNATNIPPNYYQLCATVLPPDESLIVSVTMSEEGLKEQTGGMQGELCPGKYRFVLLGISPFSGS